MMHILIIMTIMRVLFIFLGRLSIWLDGSKDSISHPLVNYHLDFFVSTWNGRQLLLFYTIISLTFYPYCRLTVGDSKSLRRFLFSGLGLSMTDGLTDRAVFRAFWSNWAK